MAVLVAMVVGKAWANWPPPPNPDDADGDGLLDAWEIQHWGNLNQTGGGDADNDGLTNLQEYQVGTLPTDSDTDNDGMLDGLEVLQGRNPLAAGTTSDSGGLLNLRVFTRSN
jgi:hypothetical protein